MMDCPPGIAEILVKILHGGLVCMRSLGCSGYADRCAVEADHLHNLPHLLAFYSPEALLYYWDVERVCYLKQVEPELQGSFETFWAQLEPHVEAIRRTIKDS